ncbi:15695_t:CDS:2, partial [Dentiscutata erythropus]
EKEKEGLVESKSTEAKRKREDLGLLGDEERKPKVNRAFGQRISRNIVKLAKHNSQSIKKNHEKENWLPKSQKKTKPTGNPDPIATTQFTTCYMVKDNILSTLEKVDALVEEEIINQAFEDTQAIKKIREVASQLRGRRRITFYTDSLLLNLVEEPEKRKMSLG